MKLDEIYYWIGFLMFWAACIVTYIYICYYLFTFTLELLGKKFRIIWVFVEFVHYRTQFKKWVKNKKRHPKADSNE